MSCAALGAVSQVLSALWQTGLTHLICDTRVYEHHPYTRFNILQLSTGNFLATLDADSPHLHLTLDSAMMSLVPTTALKENLTWNVTDEADLVSFASHENECSDSAAVDDVPDRGEGEAAQCFPATPE